MVPERLVPESLMCQNPTGNFLSADYGGEGGKGNKNKFRDLNNNNNNNITTYS
mgnify:CR=1 FL=1